MKNAHVILRLSEEDKKSLQMIAKKNKVSMSNYILTAALNRAKKDNK